MSIRTTVHESLPYIDAEPTAVERAAAQALIDAELPSIPRPSSSPPTSAEHAHTHAHASLPPLRASAFSPLIQAELARVAAAQSQPTDAATKHKHKLSAIDLTRYQEIDLPPSSSPADTSAALARAYTQNAYLSSRHAHLSLLDTPYGRHAWLVGNWQAEAELAALERDLAAARRDVDLVNLARRRRQDESAGELAGLDAAWKKGVGRALETEIAVEELRRRVDEARRDAATAAVA